MRIRVTEHMYHLAMQCVLFVLICAALALPCPAQSAEPGTAAVPATTDNAFGFEGPAGQVPAGWAGGSPGTVMVDDQVRHDGRQCVRMERKSTSEGPYSSLVKTLPMNFSGKEIELRGFLRTEKVSDYTGFWMGEYKSGVLENVRVEYKDMHLYQLDGTRDWKEYSISLRVNPTADQLKIGASFFGSGKVWIADLRLYVDGKPYTPQPKAENSTVQASPPPVAEDRSAVFAAKPVTVEQLETTLRTVQGKPDRTVATKLSGLRLTERLSNKRLSFWKAKMPGAKSSQALAVLADASAFLKLPAADVLAAAAPDVSEQRRMIGLALDYVDKAVPKLPNFFATRSTARYEDDLSIPEPVGRTIPSSQLWHTTGNYSATVLYRDGKEVVAEAAKDKKLKEEDKGLVTRGVFGPVLSTVMGDAARSGMRWSHWEEGTAGPMAVFRYAVPQSGSHYEVAYLGFSSKDGENTAHPYSGYQGEIAIDAATGTILRLTLQGEPEPGQSILRSDIMVEYGQVEIGGKIYTCPVRSVSFSELWAELVRMDFTYSTRRFRAYKTMLNEVAFKDYHLFRAEVRMLPAGETAPE